MRSTVFSYIENTVYMQLVVSHCHNFVSQIKMQLVKTAAYRQIVGSCIFYRLATNTAGYSNVHNNMIYLVLGLD